MAEIQLKGITWDHERGYDPLVAASKKYEEEFGIGIFWKKRTLKNFGDQSLDALANRFDLLIIDHPHSGIAAETGCVLPLDNFIPAQDLKTLRNASAGPSFDSFNYKGHQWALPIDAAIQCAAYRPDLVKTDLPDTWQAVLKTQKIGMALCPTDSLCSFLTLSAQMEAPIKEENTDLISKEKGVQVLQLMKALKQKAHPKSLYWNPIQLYDYMTETSEVAYSPLAFGYTNYAREGYRRHKLLFSNVPTSQNAVLGGAGIAISAHCPFKPEAAAYAEWVCSGSVQKSIYVEAGGQAAHKNAWEDKTANRLTSGFFSNTMDSIEKAYVRPRFSKWPKFQEYLGEVVHEFLRENEKEEKLIDHLNNEYRKLKLD